jgi:predicted membrane protein
MSEPPVDANGDVGDRVELRKEAWVMALYVAVCLLAALTAVAEEASDGHVRAFGIIWGTTIGLALAHAFAFRVSARIVAQGRIRRLSAVTIALLKERPERSLSVTGDGPGRRLSRVLGATSPSVPGWLGVRSDQ